MEHYFSKKPTANDELKIITCMYNSISFKFYTSSSVFSKDHIDKGTDLLIRESKLNIGKEILDFGCGYGPVGIIVSLLRKDAHITMSDVNERALALTEKNIKLNNTQATVINSNLFEKISGTFDVILSNPPNSAGKQLCYQLIEESAKHLNSHGSLQLVVNKKRGAKELAKKMEETFGNVETIGREAGYHLYMSIKK